MKPTDEEIAALLDAADHLERLAGAKGEKEAAALLAGADALCSLYRSYAYSTGNIVAIEYAESACHNAGRCV